jgi:DNA-binding response OmpR family regulator
MNILIVEDDFVIASLIQEQLELDGYDVTNVARTVKEAKEAVAQQEPDIAIVDVHLANGERGTDVASHLRKVTSAGIIFSTGDSTDLSLLQSLGDAVMTKPYRLRDLGRGLQIIAEIAQCGRTQLESPANFQLLGPVGGRGSHLRSSSLTSVPPRSFE